MRRDRSVGVAEAREELDHGGGGGATGAGVGQEGDAVGTVGAFQGGGGGEEGLEEIELAEHGGGEDGGGFAVGEEEFGYFAVADVGRGTEGGQGK